jgi:hypothetical protein
MLDPVYPESEPPTRGAVRGGCSMVRTYSPTGRARIGPDSGCGRVSAYFRL